MGDRLPVRGSNFVVTKDTIEREDSAYQRVLDGTAGLLRDKDDPVEGYPPNEFPPFVKDYPYKPSYYKPVRPITPDPDIGDIVDAYELPYWIGQAFAYLARYKRKPDKGGPLRDLHKAMECIQREIIKEERVGPR